MKRIFKITFMVMVTTFFLGSCTKDLNTSPIDPRDMISVNVYKTLSGYKQVLAKVYAGLSVTGQQGPAGNNDISGIDEGFSQYLRMYWYHQELTTDEAVISWNDQTIKNFHSQTKVNFKQHRKRQSNMSFPDIIFILPRDQINLFIPIQKQRFE